MSASPAFAANPRHTISLSPESARIQVFFKGTLVADTVHAIRLQEASYPVCLYIPRADCRMEYFVETGHQTTCPFKGTARYWTLKTGDGEAQNAVWGYDDPFDQMAAISRHAAFYSDMVDIRAGAAA